MKPHLILLTLGTLLMATSIAFAAPVPADLIAKVNALPETSNDQKLKKATLRWALEDATAQEKAGFSGRADLTVADVRALLPKKIGVPKAAPANLFTPPSAPQILPLETDFSTARESVAIILSGNRTYPKGPAGDIVESPTEGWLAIKIAYEGERLAYNLCHPQSAYAADPRLVAPMFRRFENSYEYMVPGKNPGRLANFGQSPPLSQMYLMLKTVYPDLILPSRQKQWEAAIALNAEEILKIREKLFLEAVPGTAYVNSDVKYITALMYAGILFHNPRYTAAAQGGVKLVGTAAYLDGGFAYIGWQNECPTYHSIAIAELGRYHQVTGEPLALEILKKVNNYLPLSHEPNGAGISEFSTSPSWKHNWSGVTPGITPQLLAGLTGKTWPDEAPDDYFVYDRNLQGPRSRFGNFSTSGTTRDFHNDNRGKSTYVGCMVVVPKGETITGIRPLNPMAGALDSAGSGVQMRANAIEIRSNFATLSQDERNSSLVTRDFAALGTAHSLSEFGRPATGWEGQQSWLFLSHRLVGLVAVEAKKDQSAFGVTGVLQFVSAMKGGQGITEEGQDTYKSGLLTAKIHHHDYAAIVADTAPATMTRLVLKDAAAQTSTAAVSYPTGTRHHYLVEFYPDGTQAAKDVTLLTLPDGLMGFRVSEGPKHYLVILNPTSSALTYAGKPEAHESGFQLYKSGQQYRPAWIGSDHTEEGVDGAQYLPLQGGALSFPVDANSQIIVTSLDGSNVR